MKERLYFLDHLRFFLVFLVAVVHAGMTYESGFDSFWIVSDPAKCNSIALVRMYLDIFVMSGFFFISGYFIPGSVAGKSNGEFIGSKFRRIYFPWFVAVLVLIPAYKTIFLFSRGLPPEEWFSYFHLFERPDSDLSYFPNDPNQSWLWFLPVLFLFQLVYLLLDRLRLTSFRISLKSAVIGLFVIGLLYSMLISQLGWRGWTLTPLIDFQRERLLVYFMVFLLGALCFKLQVFESGEKNKRLYLLSNIVLAIALTIFTIVSLNLFYNLMDPGRNFYFVSELVDRSFYYGSFLLAMLSFLHILLYSFRHSLNKSNPLMNRLNRNSYEVYIIHMIVVGGFALLLLPLAIPAVLKYILLIVLSFAGSHALVYGYRMLVPGSLPKALIRTISVLAVALAIVVGLKSWNYPPGQGTQMIVAPQNINLHEAALNGDLEAVNQYIAASRNIDVRDEASGSNPLTTAIVFDQTAVAKALIAAGADVNFQDKDGSTPLHAAAFFCREEMVAYLLEHGADKTIINDYQETPLAGVSKPFAEVRPAYDYFDESLGPLGLELDYERLQAARPRIAELLK